MSFSENMKTVSKKCQHIEETRIRSKVPSTSRVCVCVYSRVDTNYITYTH